MGAQKWRLIMDGARQGAENMGLDEAVLIHHSRGEVAPTVRFYGWSPPAVTIGYFGRMLGQVDPEACRRLGVDALRRPTGGRAVLHHHEVTYSVVVSTSILRGTVEETYLAISHALVYGLRTLGVEAEMVAAGKDQPGSAACFEAPSTYEIAVGGRKLVGSAQMRASGVILQHGSVLLKFDPVEMAAVLRFPTEEVRRRTAALLEGKAVGINQLGGGEFGFGRVAEALAAGFEKECGISWRPGQLTGDELGLALQLARDKYGSDEWNLKR